MNKIHAILALILVINLLITGCKKEDNTSLADKVVGNYMVNDTSASLTGCDGGPAGDVDTDSYGISITKKSDNVVTISSFNHCTASFDATVSETSLIAVENAPCTTVEDVAATISGNTIRFTYIFDAGICTFNNRATAVKQQ